MPASLSFRLSGGAANSNPLTSLGGAMSSVAASPNALFDTVTAGEASAGDTEYRCIYVFNDGDQTLDTVRLWVSDQANVGTLALALGGEGKNGTAETVANENTAPTGESFSTPTSAGTGLELATPTPFAPGDRFPIWIRRVIPAAAPGSSLAANTAQIRTDYEFVPT